MGLRLNDGSGNHVELTAPSLSSDVSLTLPNSVGTAGQFLQVGAGGVTTWATAINLIVQTEASITAPQVNQVCSCTNPAVLSGVTPYTFTYQWQFQASGGSSFSNISGATSQTYTVPVQIGSDNTEGGQLRCVVSIADSTTPAALTASSTTSAKVIVSFIYEGTPGRPYFYNGSAWVAVTVNNSTTTNTLNFNRGPNGYSWAVTESYDVYRGSQNIDSDPYNLLSNSDFGSAAKIADGIRNIAFPNNTSTWNVGAWRFAAHLVKDNDIAQGTVATPASWTYMSGTYPGYECRALMNTGFCTNQAFALIENSAGDRKIINCWYNGSTHFTGGVLNTWQDVTPTLPAGEKVKQIFGLKYAGGVYAEAVGFLTDSGNIYAVGNHGSMVNGVSNSGTLAAPVQYNPTGFTPIQEVLGFGNNVSGPSAGFSMLGKDGHLYLVTYSYPFRKILDDAATPIITGGYGGPNIVGMQDGSFRYMATASLDVVSPSFTTIAGPSGLTVDGANWKLFPSSQTGQCAWYTAGTNPTAIITIPYI
jgi:hypothetical protein